METQTVQNSWSDMKAKIKTRWNKLSDYEIESFKDNLDKISAQVQKTYGIDLERAEKEFNDFKITLQAADIPRIEPFLRPVKLHTNDEAQMEAMVSEGGGATSKAV